MVMSQSSAKTLATEIWSGPRQAEWARLTRIDEATRVRRPDESQAPNVLIPSDAPKTLRELAEKSRTNYLSLILEVFRQALRVQGYNTALPETTPWKWWLRNRLNARHAGVIDSSLKYGSAYARVAPGIDDDGEDAPTVKFFTPRYCTAIYEDVEADAWPYAATYVSGNHLVLMDEEAEYIFGWDAPRGAIQGLMKDPWAVGVGAFPGTLDYIEHRSHGVGRTPLVRFRDRMYLNGEEQLGIVEPLLGLQAKIDETNFEALVNQYFQVFQQRYVIGWVPESEAEEMRAGAARITYLDMDPKEVELGEWKQAQVNGYLEMGTQARRDMAALGQLPAQTMGTDSISNISDATLSGLETAKNRKASEISASLGEGFEQLLRLMAHVAGDRESSREYDAEITWADREARSWAGTIDGLSKLVQNEILTRNTAVGMIPNMTDPQIDKARKEIRQQTALSALNTINGVKAANSAQGAPGYNPTSPAQQRQDNSDNLPPAQRGRV